MKQFKITFKRSFVEYGTCVIDAEDEDDAWEVVRNEEIDDLDPEWGQQIDSVEECME